MHAGIIKLTIFLDEKFNLLYSTVYIGRWLPGVYIQYLHCMHLVGVLSINTCTGSASHSHIGSSCCNYIIITTMNIWVHATSKQHVHVYI